MKKICLLTILLFGILMLKPTYAAGIGYVDYDKVIHNFQYAKHTMREIDLKNAEIRKYLQEKLGALDANIKITGEGEYKLEKIG